MNVDSRELWNDSDAKTELLSLSYSHLLKRMKHKGVPDKKKDVIALEIVKRAIGQPLIINNNSMTQIDGQLKCLTTEEIRELVTLVKSGTLSEKSSRISEIGGALDQNEIRGN